jgi:hypothetical protein
MPKKAFQICTKVASEGGGVYSRRDLEAKRTQSTEAAPARAEIAEAEDALGRLHGAVVERDAISGRLVNRPLRAARGGGGNSGSRQSAKEGALGARGTAGFKSEASGALPSGHRLQPPPPAGGAKVSGAV